jgi:hypothetical protein
MSKHPARNDRKAEAGRTGTFLFQAFPRLPEPVAGLYPATPASIIKDLS